MAAIYITNILIISIHFPYKFLIVIYDIELKGRCKGEKTKGEREQKREKEKILLHCSYFRFLHCMSLCFLFYIRKQTHQHI